MAKEREIIHNCESCGKPIKMTVIDYFNSEQDAELMPMLRSYTLFNNFCPYCGGKLYPETCLLYQDIKNRIIIYYIDGKNKEEKKKEILEKISRDAIVGYRYRVVTERVNFVQKVEMILSGFDDRVIELGKWITCDSIFEYNEETDPTGVWFELDEENRPVMHINFPNDYEKIIEITPDIYAHLMDILWDLVEKAEDQICVEDEWPFDMFVELQKILYEDD